MTAKIPKNEYELYRSVIKTANEKKDKEALKQIQLQLIVRYGLCEDVKDLLAYFQYSV